MPATGQPTQGTIGSAGGQITVTASTDPLLAGTQLVIPPGAVPDGTVITISRGDEQAVGGDTAISPSVRLSPDGLVLSKPATLFLPYAPAKQPAYSALAIDITSKGVKSKQSALLVSAAAGLAQTQIAHFSDYEVVATLCANVDIGPPATINVDLSTAKVDLASSPYDLGTSPQDIGTGSTDLAPSSSDGGSSGSTDLAPSSHDAFITRGPDGSSAGNTDLAVPGGGYSVPPACYDVNPVDLASPVDFSSAADLATSKG